MARASRNPESFDRDQQILSRLAQIEHKVDSLDQTNAFVLRAEASKHQDSLREVFGKSVRRAQVYLAANGGRTVQQIADYLGMKGPNVSPELAILKDEGLLELSDNLGRGDVYAKKALDKTLRITKFLCETFELESSGQARTKAKKRK